MVTAVGTENNIDLADITPEEQNFNIEDGPPIGLQFGAGILAAMMINLIPGLSLLSTSGPYQWFAPGITLLGWQFLLSVWTLVFGVGYVRSSWDKHGKRFVGWWTAGSILFAICLIIIIAKEYFLVMLVILFPIIAGLWGGYTLVSWCVLAWLARWARTVAHTRDPVLAVQARYSHRISWLLIIVCSTGLFLKYIEPSLFAAFNSELFDENLGPRPALFLALGAITACGFGIRAWQVSHWHSVAAVLISSALVVFVVHSDLINILLPEIIQLKRSSLPLCSVEYARVARTLPGVAMAEVIVNEPDETTTVYFVPSVLDKTSTAKNNQQLIENISNTLAKIDCRDEWSRQAKRLPISKISPANPIPVSVVARVAIDLGVQLKDVQASMTVAVRNTFSGSQPNINCRNQVIYSNLSNKTCPRFLDLPDHGDGVRHIQYDINGRPRDEWEELSILKEGDYPILKELRIEVVDSD